MPKSVNRVVPASEVIPAALALAKEIVENSPDAVQATKKGLLLAQQHNLQESVLTHAWSPESKLVYKGENIKVRMLSSTMLVR